MEKLGTNADSKLNQFHQIKHPILKLWILIIFSSKISLFIFKEGQIGFLLKSRADFNSRSETAIRKKQEICFVFAKENIS